MGNDVIGAFCRQSRLTFTQREWGWGGESLCYNRSESLLPIKNVLGRRLLNLCFFPGTSPRNESRDKP